jgi:acyl-CoA synthetase (AMP-forming)/AMP-acid ligase II
MTAVKVVDVGTGKSLKRNMNGELCVKGPQVMKGYFNNPEATEAMIDRDGWLHTGDWGYYDDDNDFFVVDRIKDIIKVKGFQVSPTELENLLKTHPKIGDAAIIGVPDSRAGELPRAYVVPKPGITLSEDELHEFLKSKVAAFKQLNGGIEFVDQIPRNATGKILRKNLLSSYKQNHNIN